MSIRNRHGSFGVSDAPNMSRERAVKYEIKQGLLPNRSFSTTEVLPC